MKRDVTEPVSRNVITEVNPNPTRLEFRRRTESTWGIGVLRDWKWLINT